MDWDDHASTWDDDPAVVTYAAGAFECLGRLLEARGRSLEGTRVLDFGCGTGLLSEALAPKCREVVSLDPAAKMVEVLRKKVERQGWSHVHPVVGTLEESIAAGHPQLRAPFDLIACSSVCAFLPDYPGTLKRLAAMLAPGGHFVQFDWERDESDEEPFGLSRSVVQEALSEAGLVDLVVDTAFERHMGEVTMKPLVGFGRRKA